MKRLLFAATGLALAFTCHAQTSLKKPLLPYFSQLPAPPTSLESAYSGCQCVTNGQIQTNGAGVAANVHSAVGADMQSMGQMTATQTQQAQQGMAIANQANADNVNKMSKTDQLTWVQNNMQGYGNAAGQASFAQKMQDPAEKARFKAMTPDQQMAYMKQAGIDPSKSMTPTVAPANIPAANAINAQKQFMTDLMSAQSRQLTMALDSLLTNQDRPHAPIDANMRNELAQLIQGESTTSQSVINSKRQAVEAKYLQQHLTLAQQQLPQMVKAYNTLLNYYHGLVAPLDDSLQAAHYGYTGDAMQQNYVSQFASGQASILGLVTTMEGYLNRIYQFGATWQGKKLQAGTQKN